jgi:hypothetical protein
MVFAACGPVARAAKADVWPVPEYQNVCNVEKSRGVVLQKKTKKMNVVDDDSDDDVVVAVLTRRRPRSSRVVICTRSESQ